jgi:hypothetical protein
MKEWKIDEVADLIERMRSIAEEMKNKAAGLETVQRNLVRILANIRMLELNISDVKELL